jgi:hypothetical protein
MIRHQSVRFFLQSDSNTLTVNSMDSMRTDPNPESRNDPGNADLVIPVPTISAPTDNTGFTTMTPQQIAGWIDKRSRVLFPACFVVFNVLYWGFVWI